LHKQQISGSLDSRALIMTTKKFFIINSKVDV